MDSTLHVVHVGIGQEVRSAINQRLLQSDRAVDVRSDPDAESALSRLDDAPAAVDCVVSAYHLPGMNGVEFCREQNSRFPESNVRFVLFVEDGSEEIAAAALNAGVSAYVRRDRPDAIRRLVERVQQDVERTPPRASHDAADSPQIYREQLQWERDRLEEVRRVISHDLRSPLNVAKGYLQNVAAETDDSDQQRETTSESIPRALSALDRLESFFDDLNTLIQQGSPIEGAEPVDPLAVARTAWANTHTPNASLRIVDGDTPASGEMVADQQRLLELFQELFRNAIAHGRPDVTIEVGPLSEGFYVADDGGGIPDNRREDVLQAGVSDCRDRTGFGLARVRHIAAAHGWDVSVGDSAEGGRFEFTELREQTRATESRDTGV